MIQIFSLIQCTGNQRVSFLLKEIKKHKLSGDCFDQRVGKTVLCQ